MNQPDDPHQHANLLTVHDVAQRLRVSRHAIYRACRRGDLQPLRIFGHMRFEPIEVERFLAEARRPRPATGVVPPPHPVPPVRQDAAPLSFRDRRKARQEARG